MSHYHFEAKRPFLKHINKWNTDQKNGKDQGNQELVFQKDQIDKPLTRLRGKKFKIKNERGDITTDTTKIQRIIEIAMYNIHLQTV